MIDVRLMKFTVACVLAAAFTVFFAGPPARAALAEQQPDPAKILAEKIAVVVSALPSDASEGGFEAAILGVTAGQRCDLVKSALALARPTMPAAAVTASKAVANACGPIGALGASYPRLALAPGFAPGGGGYGPNYSQ